MSKQSNESILPAVLLFGTWYALATYTSIPVGPAFVCSVAILCAGWLALRMGSASVYRLGPKAWKLMLQLASWCALFLWAAPLQPVQKGLLLWGIALPLAVIGGAWRQLFERVPRLQGWMVWLPRSVLSASFVHLLLFHWSRDAGVLYAVGAAAITCGLAAVPLYYGWLLGEPLLRGERDARFGTGDTYRAAGMSDER